MGQIRLLEDVVESIRGEEVHRGYLFVLNNGLQLEGTDYDLGISYAKINEESDLSSLNEGDQQHWGRAKLWNDYRPIPYIKRSDVSEGTVNLDELEMMRVQSECITEFLFFDGDQIMLYKFVGKQKRKSRYEFEEVEVLKPDQIPKTAYAQAMSERSDFSGIFQVPPSAPEATGK